jgi:hypothetical protein
MYLPGIPAYVVTAFRHPSLCGTCACCTSQPGDSLETIFFSLDNHETA